MRPVWRWRSTDRSTTACIPRWPVRIGGALVTADLRFANALAPAEHGRAVVALADFAG